MKKNKLPSIITLLILSLITAFFWVTFTVYRAFTKPVTVDLPAEVLEPLNPTLDSNLLGTLEKRLYIEEDQIQTAPTVATSQSTSSPTPTASLAPEESASSSATPVATASATP